MFCFRPMSSGYSSEFRERGREGRLRGLVPRLSLSGSSSFFRPSSILLRRCLLRIYGPVPTLLHGGGNSNYSFLCLERIHSRPVGSVSPARLLRPISPRETVLKVPRSGTINGRYLAFRSLLRCCARIIYLWVQCSTYACSSKAIFSTS